MPTNLFTAPLDTVTAEDVLAFLEEDRPEGPVLDYKAENSQRLGIPELATDAITAFANTYGGLLILGVGSDAKTNRPTSRDGLTLTKKKLEEALISRCYSSIVPPVVPEVRVCPFKSNPALISDDRAFVVARVAPGVGGPHALNGNQVKVRVGSQCQLADIPTLRLFFERERQREGSLATLDDAVLQQMAALRTRFAGEKQQPRWAPNSFRIYLDLLPLDTPGELLPFGELIPSIGSLDKHIAKLVQLAGWTVVDSGSIRMPRGLGLIGVYHGRQSLTNEQKANDPATTLYFDRSGAMMVDMPAASLGTVQPHLVGSDTYQFSQQLLYRVAQLVDVATQIQSQRQYAGRIRVTIWIDKGVGLDRSQELGDRGSTEASLIEPWDDFKMRLTTMVSQMTRSWLGFEFTVHSWQKGAEPQFMEF